MSKECCSFLYSNSIYKNGQDFFNKQYVYVHRLYRILRLFMEMKRYFLYVFFVTKVSLILCIQRWTIYLIDIRIATASPRILDQIYNHTFHIEMDKNFWT